MKILHLYPDYMNLYGEYGNIEVLKRHLIDQGIRVSIDRVSINDEFEFDDYDFVYCGSGYETNFKIVLKDLKKRKQSLVKAVKNNTYMLFTGNAMELLASSIDGKSALNIAPISVKTSNKRFTGDVVEYNEDLGEIVGFINKSTIIESKTGLFKYIFKDKNLNDKSMFEGYRINNLIGTHIIGPILTKNPKLLRFFVESLAKSKKKTFEYKEISYPYEEDSYYVTLNSLKQRKK